MEDIEKLTRRLEKLERQSRILRVLAAFCVLGTAAVLLMGQTTTPPRSVPEGRQTFTNTSGAIEAKVRAQEFALVDAKGEERASLVTDGTGAVFFVMFDTNGKARADLHVGSEGPSLNFYDPNSKSRFVAGGTSLVASHVASETGTVEKNPSSSIVMFDKDGKLLWRTP